MFAFLSRDWSLKTGKAAIVHYSSFNVGTMTIDREIYSGNIPMEGSSR
jgi:hypothetical protein